jgi:predicted lactoylglutathione lyase
MSKGIITVTIIVFSLTACKQQYKKSGQMESRFTILTLGVDNLEKSYKFYHEGMGLPSQGIVGKEFEHGEVAFFDLQHGMKLALYSRANLAWDSKVEAEKSAATEFSIGYTVRSKEEVDTILAKAKKAGAKIPKPAQTAFWGGYSGYFQDLDGHLWEIAWNPNLMPED